MSTAKPVKVSPSIDQVELSFEHEVDLEDEKGGIGKRVDSVTAAHESNNSAGNAISSTDSVQVENHLNGVIPTINNNSSSKASIETVESSNVYSSLATVGGDESGWAMRLKGASAILGGFLIHLTLGAFFFTIGNVTPYIMSYLRIRAGYDNVTYALSIWINALAYLGQGGLMFVGGLLEKKIGGRLTCFIGGCIFCGSIALSGWLIRYGFIVFAVFYGLISCIGLGIAYIPPLAVGMRWFPRHQGIANGVVLGGYGLGALVFNPIQTAFLNPQNENSEDDGFFHSLNILDRVPEMLYVLGATYGALQMIGILLLFSPDVNNKESKDLLKNAKGATTRNGKLYSTEDGKPEKFSAQTSKTCYSLEVKEMGPCQMLRKKEFYLLWIVFALISQCIQFINTYYKTYGQLFIHDDKFLTIVGSFASLCNCLGRIVWGRVLDVTSYKLVAVIISLTLTALMCSFLVVPYGLKYTFVIWVLAAFFFFSGIFTITATATSQCFGGKHSGTNFGVVFTAPALSSILGAVVIQFILAKLSWMGTFFVIAGFTFVAFIATLFVPNNLELVS